MTIRKGEPWGEPAVIPANARVVDDDAGLREWVTFHRERDQPIPDVVIGGGDMARTLGAGQRDQRAGTRVTLDIVQVRSGGMTTWAVSHVIARGQWWRGPLTLAMNSQFLGAFDVAPRAHPNDGVIDVLTVNAALSVRQRLSARQRARTGSHVPHPLMAMRRASSITLELDRSQSLWIDGVCLGAFDSVDLTVEPDAYTAYL